jgi:Fe-S cluster biogenesis protein NfuA
MSKSAKPASRTGSKPATKVTTVNPINAQIVAALSKVSQYLQVDGGDVQFVSYNASNGEVSVRLQGHCAGCVHAQMTIKNLVEQSLKEMIGEDKIKKVVAVM